MVHNELIPYSILSNQESDRLVRGAIFFDDGTVIRVNGHFIFLALPVGAPELHQDVADALELLALPDVELDVVALAFASQFRQLGRIPRDQYAQVASIVCKFLTSQIG